MSRKQQKEPKQPVRVLPADVYDTLELSALAYGGIGAQRFYDQDYPVGEPYCAFGHAYFASGSTDSPYMTDNKITAALVKAGIYVADNDKAVRRYNTQLGRHPNARIPFDDWCRILNVRRGA